MLRTSLTGFVIITAFALATGPTPAAAQAQGGHGQHDSGPHRPESPEIQQAIADLREATARFHDLDVAIQQGYAPFGPCFIDPTGGMGFHYANAELMEDPGVDPLHPELLLYEQQQDGSLVFVGVEYLAFQAEWHEAGNRGVPKLFGQRFHLNTTLLSEPFYLLHVWQWKHNPSGRFNDWNPRVACP